MRRHFINYPHILIVMLAWTFLLPAPAHSEEKDISKYFRDYLALKLDRIEFTETRLDEALEFIRLKIRDVAPEGIGLGMIIKDGGEEGAATRVITYEKKDVTLDKLYTDLAKHFDLEIHVTSLGLRIHPARGNLSPEFKKRKRTIYKTYRP